MDDAALPPPRRYGPRDWAIDTGLFLAAAGYGIGWSVELIDDPGVAETRLLWFQVIAALACAALWLRRRWPLGVAVVMVPVATVVDLATGAQLVALFTVAIHRPVRLTMAIGAMMVAARSGFLMVVDPPNLFQLVMFTLVTNLAVVGWGLFIRHRGQLMRSLEERARRAETEAHLRAERAQHMAREQIAREMHDVLGHRLSLLSVHAGALEYRPDAPPDEVARAAAVIRESAHQALQDLREVIGVLRAPVGELPLPTLADVRTLVEESRGAGMRVELRERVTGGVPDGIGRTAYRAVQEGLTNARRHAPGAWVEVTVEGAPGEELVIEVSNTAPATVRAAADGTGRGGTGGWSDGDRAESATGGTSGALDGWGTGATGPESSAEVDVRDRVGARPASGSGERPRAEPGAPGSGGPATGTPGQGLVGLAERVSLANGRLDNGPTASGGFHLRVWLPWSL